MEGPDVEWSRHIFILGGDRQAMSVIDNPKQGVLPCNESSSKDPTFIQGTLLRTRMQAPVTERFNGCLRTVDG
ncbi:hypothetical protein D2Q93_05300 [Alicyclobacillaceae bacterium I2511]|nr:hypothetical protein D2Q93_05300 [Alicyclobacillaceae bacterium I2511]